MDTDDPAIAGIEPRVDTNEASFLPLWRSLARRCPVSFDYQRPGAAPTRRRVEPWGIVSWHGRWYLVGHDRDRGATRVFRLSRITGDVVTVGAPGEVTVPEGADVRREVARFAGEQNPRGLARVRVRVGSAGFLRRQATSEASDGDGWDVLEVPMADADQFADGVVGLGAAAVVLEPAEARAAVVARLQGVLAGAVAAEAAPVDAP